MSSIKLVLSPKEHDLGAFSVQRAIPSAKQKLVGPFIFFDHIGPAEFASGKGIDVRPHPHTCLSTVTYLFEGGMLHRDTLDTEIEVHPGAVNLMTAGKGIAHSERTPVELEKNGHRLHGIQTWLALPKSHEECDPAFDHYPAADIPEAMIGPAKVRVVMGQAYELTSPVRFPHETLYVVAETETECSLPIPAETEERAAYVVSGTMTFEGHTFTEGQMVVFEAGDIGSVELAANTRIAIIGGTPHTERRYIEWNFVASTKERIDQAKEDWRASIAGNWQDTPFGMPPNEDEFIPLPEDQ